MRQIAINRGRDGMVDITDLKSVGLVPWGFKSPRPHHDDVNKFTLFMPIHLF